MMPCNAYVNTSKAGLITFNKLANIIAKIISFNIILCLVLLMKT